MVGYGDAARPAPFPAWAGGAERLRYLLAYAIEAPSRYENQPWLFEIEGDELRVFVDRRRALRAADPHGRQLVVACGAAVESLRVAAAHFGHLVEPLPVAGLAGEPVARIRLGERHHPTPADEELFEALLPRRRGPSAAPEPVPQPLLAELAREVEPCALRVLPDWVAAGVAGLVTEAEAAQWASARFRAELAAWTVRRRKHGASAPDQSRGRSGLLRRLLGRGPGARAEAARRRADRARTLIVVHTESDGSSDWLSAGAAMQRLLLRASARGYAATLFHPAIEVADVRRRLRTAAGFSGWPQMLLRLGRGPTPERAPRRPIDLVLRSFTSEVAVTVEVADAARAG